MKKEDMDSTRGDDQIKINVAGKAAPNFSKIA
jgi:hypothetical protein